MGHLVGKDLYRKLGKKIDGLTMRSPWNKTLYDILKELYTPEEAELVVRMPYGFNSLDYVEKVTGFERANLEKLLGGLSEKGLLIDVCVKDSYYYIISPMVIGIFEFTMMRTRGELDLKKWAELFHSYMHDGSDFYSTNFGKGKMISPLRALPYEDAFTDSDFVEVLDYEKATVIIENTDSFAIGICSCRHEKLHAGQKKCDIPLETCSTFGFSTKYMINHGFAREVSKSEMLENLARSREMSLVLCADNIKKDIGFICHCCGCCCNVLLGISQHGFTNSVVSSNYMAEVDNQECIECGICAEICPVNAIELNADDHPKVDESICLGCGVCALNCSSASMKLTKRNQRVFHPENTFERIILQCLERGTLQNMMFNDPQKVTHKFMRGFVGGFLRLPPVKKALMSDSLRSSFLNFMAGKK